MIGLGNDWASAGSGRRWLGLLHQAGAERAPMIRIAYVGPPLTDDLIDHARGRLSGMQLRIFDRLLQDATPQQICDELDVDAQQLSLATDALILKLGVDVPVTGA